jgi:hypothetical protein
MNFLKGSNMKASDGFVIALSFVVSMFVAN